MDDLESPESPDMDAVTGSPLKLIPVSDDALDNQHASENEILSSEVKSFIWIKSMKKKDIFFVKQGFLLLNRLLCYLSWQAQRIICIGPQIFPITQDLILLI